MSRLGCRSITTTLLILLVSGLAFAGDVALPKGWHKPSASVAAEDFRKRDPNRYLSVTGDFNEDGTQDKALLLVNDQNSKFGLFVCLANSTGCDWLSVEEADLAYLESMGIAKVKPGQYETSCGKGYWDCAKGEPEKLSVKKSAIEFFKDESASSFYIYNSKTKKFVNVSISD